MIGSSTHKKFALWVMLAGLMISCSTSKNASITLVSDFGEDRYVNPQDFGYALSIREIEENPPADSSFVPVAVKGGMRQAFGQVRYPMEAQKQGIKGRVMLRLYVDNSGSLTKAEVLESPHKLLTDAALNAAQKWEYVSAMLNGTPVNSFIQVPLNFRMQTQKIDIDN